MPNLRPGVDTPPPANFILAKVNLPFDDASQLVAAMTDLEAVNRELVDASRQHEGKSVVDGWGLNLLVAFGLRFFLGPLEGRGAEEPVPNFPPGGMFTPRTPTRFGMSNRHVPLYLRTMAAAGDRDFVGLRLAAETGAQPSEADIDAAYGAWLAANESDLLLYIEGDDMSLCEDLWARVKVDVVDKHGLELAMPIDASFGTGDGRDRIGWQDPISNMEDLIENQPQYYRSKIYVPHPAPAFPGESLSNRDDTRYDGGTYLVHRKYIENLDKWNSDDFTITDNYGRTYTGDEARNRAIGRDRDTGQVIRASNGELLNKEYDSQDAHLAPLDSHILMARGGNPAPFAGPFPGAEAGDIRAFDIQDIRIRRRGGNYRELDDDGNETVIGLHFVCFQNNIQQTGFEFINNIWLLNPLFRLNGDHLLDPEKGIGEPIGGCYYFVPAPHRDHAAEVFFD